MSYIIERKSDIVEYYKVLLLQETTNYTTIVWILLTIILVITGVAVWINVYGAKRMIQEAINKEIEQFKKDISDNADKLIKDKFIEIDKQVKKIEVEIELRTFFLQGSAAYQKKNMKGAYSNFITAGIAAINCENLQNLNGILNNICRILDKITNEDIEDLKTEDVNIEELFEALEKVNQNGIFNDRIINMKRKLKKITIQNNELLKS